MGCDCHMILQKKVKGKYITVGSLSINRCYDFFGILAGVRSDVKPIAYPKGYPKDLEVFTDKHNDLNNCVYCPDEDEDYYWLGDHSHSYLDLNELRRYNWEKVEKEIGYNPCPEDLRELMAFGKNKYRIVFGFDS